MAALITLDTQKQQNGVSEAFNIQELFNARVGDEQVPFSVKFLERGKAQQFEDGLVPFMSGFVGNLDDDGKVTAETGEPVSYTGSRDDIVGLGMVKMNLPGMMFPQEGYFYGFLGLETPDHSKRVSTFSIWFHVYNGNPDMFVNKEPFRSELQKELDRVEVLIEQTEGTIKAKFIEWEKLITDLISNKNIDLEQLESRMATVEGNLTILEDKIKADGLLTQADLDVFFADFKIKIQSGLEQITEFNEGVKNMNITDVDGGIPEYMLNVLNTANSGIDKTKFNLVFATDHHYNIASDYDTFGATSLPKLTPLWDSGLRKVLNATAIKNADAVVFNGDNVDEPITPNSYDAMLNDPTVERKMNVKELQDFFTTASSSATIPAFVLKGNHDQNYHASKGYKDPSLIISDAEWASMYKNAVRDYGEIRNGDSNYFYKDFADKKIRLIGLDSYDLPETVEDKAAKFYRFESSGFQQDQLDWLANTALKVSEGTTVVITLHHPVDGTLASDSHVINHNVLYQILSGFAEGKAGSASGTNSDVPVSVAYSFEGAGLIAGVLSGHRHLDSNVTKNGINYIETRCSSSALDSMIKDARWNDAGTPLEDAFDIVSIDTTAKTIDLKRVGAGSEDDRFATRHFNY
ncbi:metallophosphoesterase [Pediococcus pentosaceus]|uniref:metallophosphoesterase family protein n=1 Tax=Pediococcus pentosaceus TaxID=1255 RepID=UPI00190CEC54|nr:metallophosphoesterase [Pediococcus pentosaceus]MBF7125639.1 metallophosphoesterase [Pediococcus pentosaceus]WPK17309.1 metallophosphoesterase [Pediococcus pentosaceus]